MSHGIDEVRRITGIASARFRCEISLTKKRRNGNASQQKNNVERVHSGLFNNGIEPYIEVMKNVVAQKFGLKKSDHASIETNSQQ